MNHSFFLGNDLTRSEEDMVQFKIFAVSFLTKKKSYELEKLMNLNSLSFNMIISLISYNHSDKMINHN